MFQEFEGMLQKVTSGGVSGEAVGQAAGEHVNSMDSSELAQHVQVASDNAQQNGDTSVAQQLAALVQQNATNPEGLKTAIVRFITSNPQILAHFAPEFAQRILGSL